MSQDLHAARAVVRATGLPWQQLEDSLLAVAERFSLDWISIHRYKKLGTIEAIAHELAHLLDLDESYEAALDAMEDAEANKREGSTLRIEVAALRALGTPLLLRRLWAHANWRGGGPKPTLAQMGAPLSRREQQRVDRFVSIVITEHLLGKWV